MRRWWQRQRCCRSLAPNRLLTPCSPCSLLPLTEEAHAQVAIAPTLLVALVYRHRRGTELDQLNEFVNVLQSIQLPFALLPARFAFHYCKLQTTRISLMCPCLHTLMGKLLHPAALCAAAGVPCLPLLQITTYRISLMRPCLHTSMGKLLGKVVRPRARPQKAQGDALALWVALCGALDVTPGSCKACTCPSSLGRNACGTPRMTRSAMSAKAASDAGRC